MPTVIQTSTAATATGVGPGRRLDSNQDGTQWAVFESASGTLALRYSKDSGATWTASSATIATAHRPSLFIDKNDIAWLAYRDSGTGNALLNRGTPNAGRTDWTWAGGFTVENSNLSEHVDVVAHAEGSDTAVHYVSAYVSGSINFTQYRRLIYNTAGTLLSSTAANTSIGGDYAAGVSTYPSIDFNHTGDGKTVAGGTPHLYVGWSAGTTGAGKGVRFRKAVYATGAWTWNAEREIDSTRTVNTLGAWLLAQHDGTRAVIVGQLTSDEFVLWDRDAADTTTTTTVLIASATAANALSFGSATYDSAGNVYLIGRDGTGATGTRKLNYRKWTRSTATLGAITTFDTTGNDTPHVSAQRGYGGSAIRWVYTDGTASPYSVTFDKITLNVAPNAPTGLAPAGNTSVDRTITQRLMWTFSDADAGDTQSKFDLEHRVGAGAFTLVSITTPSNFWDAPPSTFPAGTVEWRVRTYDQAGLPGPYSPSAFFVAATPPAGPTITSPTNNSTVSSSTAPLVWSYPTQSEYRVRKVADLAGAPDTATVYFDTGNVISTSTRSVTLDFPVNNRAEHLQVQIRDSGTGLWSPYSSVKVTVSFTPPATPSVTITTFNTDGTIALAITDPTPSGGQPAVAYHDVLVRVSANSTRSDPYRPGEMRIATFVPSTYIDRAPASGVLYEFLVRAVAANGTVADSAWTA